MNRVTLSRRVTFSSGHRYWFDDRSLEENKALFGPWASPFNHGHNYVLWVTTSGPIDPAHGMVVNIKEIDDAVKQRVVSQFDQKSINDEVDSMRGVAPSVENLLRRFAQDLQGLPGGVSLDSLKLEETPLFYGEWQAEGMITLTRTYEFAASHRLHVPSMTQELNTELFGKCNNARGHGHNYILEVTVSGTPDPTTGMMCDLGALDTVVEREVVDRYDHKNLSEDIPEFSGLNATSEVVVAEIFKRLDGRLPARLERVRLYETARNMFEVVREPA